MNRNTPTDWNFAVWRALTVAPHALATSNRKLESSDRDLLSYRRERNGYYRPNDIAPAADPVRLALKRMKYQKSKALFHHTDLKLSRRRFLEYSAFCGGAMWTGNQLASAASGSSTHPIVNTTSGAVRGVVAQEAYIFRGVPYAASTHGVNRFLPPKNLAPWTGVRDALTYGPMAMQSGDLTTHAFDRWAATDSGGLLKGLFKRPPTPMSEDCLVLNIWTSGLDKQRKQPVMVWLHGGGFGAGSGNWGWTEGANLARFHNVVVVSLNHRLNIFGFLSLGEVVGTNYADSGNAGMLDILAALRWVRDNIAAFGGDPDNVTIFGQSGGGSKVNVLMAMPAAQGLFHKAINMSGPAPRMLPQAQATETAKEVLKHLDIQSNQIEKLQAVPASSILAAMNSVLAEAKLEGADGTWRNGTFLHMFDPVVDGCALPRDPFYPDAPAISAGVPLLIGNMGSEEQSTVLDMLGLRREVSEGQMRIKLCSMGISDVQASYLINGYRASRPKASGVEIFSAILSDLGFRRDAITIAERKTAQRKGSVYMYLFTWESTSFGGKFRASHSLDIPFVFDNIDRAPGMFGSTPDPQRYVLAKQVSEAWTSFARNGDPNHSGLPIWKPYEMSERATMLLKYSPELVNDPGRQDRLIWQTFDSKTA